MQCISINITGGRFFLLLLVALMAATACERERIVDPGPDTTAPLPPTGLLIDNAHDGFILFSWLRNTEIDLHGYIIYRAEEADSTVFVAIDTTAEQYYFDTQRSYDTTYFYRITAIDRSGNESSARETVSARADNRYPPDAPAVLHVNGFNDGAQQLFRLSWSLVDEADLAGYRVYKSVAPFDAASSSLHLTDSETAFIDDHVAAQTGQRFFYAVTAVDRAGLESPLTPLGSDFIAQRPIQLSPADNGTGQSYPLLRWLRSSDAAAYLLTVSLSEHTGDLWSAIIRQGEQDTLTFRYKGAALNIGNTYYWRVSSITKAGNKPNGVSEAWRFQVQN
ncbi:MAG: hypothetical protein KFH87_14360 [Bacteroidetes bacterium]|nr:hypothetical protein [Bacteroidota bacterium]